MRGLIGGILLVAGVGGLSYWGAKDQAQDMQASINAAANAAVEGSVHGITASVQGRDITAAGVANTPEEKAGVLAALNDVKGRRIVRDNISVLDRATPYGLTIGKTDDGITLSGHVPSDAVRAEITGADARALTLAAGAPDDFATAANASIAAAKTLRTAEVVISDSTITVTGEAQDPAAREASIAAFSPLSDGWQITENVELFDDGAPFGMMLTWDGDSTTGTGKLPAGADDLADTAPVGDLPDDVVIARIADDSGTWTDMSRSALAALAGTESGDLAINDRSLTLSGSVSNPDALAAVNAALAEAEAAGAKVTADLTLLDDGAPFSLIADWDGTSINASGKLPAGAKASLMTGSLGALGDDVTESGLPDPTSQWPDLAQTGLDALALLTDGTLTIADGALNLTGNAPGTAAKAEVEAMLAKVTDVEVTTDLTLVDDGAPVAFELSYSADGGFTVSGKLPEGVTLDDLSAALGVPVGGNVTTAIGAGNADATMAALAGVAGFLPEFEKLTFTDSGAGLSLTGDTAPGVDNELVLAGLADALGDRLTAAPTIATTTNLPDDGATRTNAATGMSETFRGGYWIPVVDFDPTPENCKTEIATIQARNKINFVTGSARLDARSVRAVNAMTSVMYLCIGDAGLSAIVGGHTDAQGSDDANLALSQQRAESVTQALTLRGIPNAALTATGYGESQPVADNETAEGRAANRRTTIEWVVSE